MASAIIIQTQRNSKMNTRSGLIAMSIAGAVILSLTQFPFVSTMQTRTDYSAALDRIYVAYKDARVQCEPLAGHDRDRCVVDARAKDKRAKATAEVNYKGTIKATTDSRIANADADLMIARVACDTTVGQERHACVKHAKAANVKLVTDARADEATVVARFGMSPS
jgi:hypothetical protein